MTDVCLCEYTSHGHCGIVEGDEIVNDVTVMHLAQAALSHAVAGADFVAPSDMMDGRVARSGARSTSAASSRRRIMSYAAKYCSGFYGPFREAADSTPQFGDRRSHQMDPANVDEALREVEIDIAEGADIIMVKPALPVSRCSQQGEGALRPADGRLPGQRRVLDDQGGGRTRLDRRAARDVGNADQHPPRRRRHDHHLLRARGSSLARVRMQNADAKPDSRSAVLHFDSAFELHRA